MNVIMKKTNEIPEVIKSITHISDQHNSFIKIQKQQNEEIKKLSLQNNLFIEENKKQNKVINDLENRICKLNK